LTAATFDSDAAWSLLIPGFSRISTEKDMEKEEL